MYATIAGFALFNYFITRTGWAVDVAEWVAGLGLSGLVLILIVDVVFLAMGFVMEPWTIIILTIPILKPIFIAQDMNLVWIGTLMAINALVGECTPPMAIQLYITSRVSKIDVEKVIKGVWPFLGVNFAMLLLVTFFPQIATALPNLLGLRLSY